MDQGALVGTQIEEGQRLLTLLIEEGIPVTGAAWLNEGEDGPWTLYIVTPLVPDNGATREAYRRVIDVIRRVPEPHGLYSLEFKLVEPDSPVGKAVQELWKHYPRRPPVWHGGMAYGGMSTEGAYVYPPPAPAGRRA